MKLNLRVDKYLDSDGGPPPQVFATIYAVDHLDHLLEIVAAQTLALRRQAGKAQLCRVLHHHFIRGDDERRLGNGEEEADRLEGIDDLRGVASVQIVDDDHQPVQLGVREYLLELRLELADSVVNLLRHLGIFDVFGGTVHDGVGGRLLRGHRDLGAQ